MTEIPPGIDTIPLKINSKRCFIEDWPNLPSIELWETAPDDHTNIGWRAGNGWGYVDCDNPETTQQAAAYFEGLGIDVPEIETRSGNRHFWLKLSDPPGHRNKTNLPKPLQGHFGFGRGAYAVAPPSIVDGFDYTLKRAGTEETPTVDWLDLQPLVGAKPQKQRPTIEGDYLPVPVLYRELPPNHRALYLMQQLVDAEKGQPIERYATRSETEAAIMCYLILNGWTFGQFWQLLSTCSTMRAENRTIRAYRRDWGRCLENIASNETRRQIEGVYKRFAAITMQRATDRRVLLGLLSIAYRFDRLTVAAASRDIAQLATVHPATASRALARLMQADLVERAPPESPGFGVTASYSIAPMINTMTSPKATRDTIVSYDAQSTTPRIIKRSSVQSEHVSQLWAKLGGVAYAVHRALGQDGHNISQLARLTGHGRAAVRRALHNLAALELAERSNGRWYVGPASTLEAAIAAGVEDTIATRRAKIKTDRDIFNAL